MVLKSALQLAEDVPSGAQCDRCRFSSRPSSNDMVEPSLPAGENLAAKLQLPVGRKTLPYEQVIMQCLLVGIITDTR